MFSSRDTGGDEAPDPCLGKRAFSRDASGSVGAPPEADGRDAREDDHHRGKEVPNRGAGLKMLRELEHVVMQVDQADIRGDHGEQIDRPQVPLRLHTKSLERITNVEGDHQAQDEQRQRINHIVPDRLDTGRVEREVRVAAEDGDRGDPTQEGDESEEAGQLGTGRRYKVEELECFKSNGEGNQMIEGKVRDTFPPPPMAPQPSPKDPDGGDG